MQRLNITAVIAFVKCIFDDRKVTKNGRFLLPISFAYSSPTDPQL
jgi:hypothetical protein